MGPIGGGGHIPPSIGVNQGTSGASNDSLKQEIQGYVSSGNTAALQALIEKALTPGNMPLTVGLMNLYITSDSFKENPMGLFSEFGELAGEHPTDLSIAMLNFLGPNANSNSPIAQYPTQLPVVGNQIKEILSGPRDGSFITNLQSMLSSPAGVEEFATYFLANPNGYGPRDVFTMLNEIHLGLSGTAPYNDPNWLALRLEQAVPS